MAKTKSKSDDKNKARGKANSKAKRKADIRIAHCGGGRGRWQGWRRAQARQDGQDQTRGLRGRTPARLHYDCSKRARSCFTTDSAFPRAPSRRHHLRLLRPAGCRAPLLARTGQGSDYEDPHSEYCQ
jgi:hypothetical protein